MLIYGTFIIVDNIIHTDGYQTNEGYYNKMLAFLREYRVQLLKNTETRVVVDNYILYIAKYTNVIFVNAFEDGEFPNRHLSLREFSYWFATLTTINKIEK